MSTNSEMIDQEAIACNYGNKLKTAREAMGLTQKDAGAQLRFNERIIPMLESGQYDSKLPTTFLRGYLRSYGKFLNVHDDDIRIALEPIQYQPSPLENPAAKKSNHASGIKNKYLMRITTYFIGASVIGLAGVWWVGHSPSFSFLSQQVALNVPDANSSAPSTEPTNPNQTAEAAAPLMMAEGNTTEQAPPTMNSADTSTQLEPANKESNTIAENGTNTNKAIKAKTNRQSTKAKSSSSSDNRTDIEEED